jgi:hypothetical protein
MKVFAAIAMMFAGLANAQTHTQTEIPPELAALLDSLPNSTGQWHRFPSLHEAVMYQANRLEECSHYYECAAVIAIDPKGKFTASAVHTDYESDHVSMSVDVPIGWQLAASIHSHPCIPHHSVNLFSPQDIMGAIIYHEPAAYMVDMCAGDVHEFIPGVTQPATTKFDDIWLSGGNIVGHVAAFKDAPLAKEGI